MFDKKFRSYSLEKLWQVEKYSIDYIYSANKNTLSFSK